MSFRRFLEWLRGVPGPAFFDAVPELHRDTCHALVKTICRFTGAGQRLSNGEGTGTFLDSLPWRCFAEFHEHNFPSDDDEDSGGEQHSGLPFR